MVLQSKFHVKLLFVLFLLVPFLGCSQNITKTVLQVKPLPRLPVEDAEVNRFTSSFPAFNGMAEGYKEWFYWTNYSRFKPKIFWDSVIVPILSIYPNLNTSYAATLKRDLYGSPALPMFKPNASLGRVAQQHANDLATNATGSLSHSSTNGTTFQQRMSNARIERCAGENLSLGPFNPVLALILLYIDEGIRDVGHRKTLLNPAYTEMGIGINKLSGASVVVVQDFACNQSQP